QIRLPHKPAPFALFSNPYQGIKQSSTIYSSIYNIVRELTGCASLFWDEIAKTQLDRPLDD
ncbi:MAG: hypothetical protein MI824_19085, partial [Hyphomicrobiales bacterium]|nr:hypothetical protein [Hyphomicrobiales bacterium]